LRCCCVDVPTTLHNQTLQWTGPATSVLVKWQPVGAVPAIERWSVIRCRLSGMWWRYPYNPTAYDDDWEDQPGQGPFYKWGLGVGLPLLLGSYGSYAIVMRQIDFGSRITMTLHGLNAVAFGIAWCAAAIFVHCHYFWGNIYDQAWFAVLGKIVSACAFIGGLVFVLVRNGVLGIG
jgi:hypothetical protein